MDLLKPGQTFAQRYRIEKFLAQGGMGAVFVGDHVATDQRVAVKVLWPHVLGSKDAVEKFQFEARVAGRVQSEHIVRVIDAGFDDETRMPFLVMELLSGKTLESVVEHEGPLTPDRLATYFRQVCSGLDRAHGYVDKDGVPKPIVHRDLKPENLFVTTRDSGEPLVKILDFGIAKVVSEGTKMSQEVKGTPLFMAYEQAGAGKITPQTDIWALGLIAFWLLTGKSYWKSASDENAGITQLFGEVLAMPIAPPTERIRELGGVPTWSPAFDAWFLKCLDRDPSKRFATAGEAARELAAAFGISIASSGNDLGRPSFVGAAPAAMAGTAIANPLGATTASGGAPVAIVPPSPGMPMTSTAGISSQIQPAPATASGGSKTALFAIAGVAALAIVAGGGFLVLGKKTTGDPTTATHTSVSADPPAASVDATKTAPAATASATAAATASATASTPVAAPIVPSASAAPIAPVTHVGGYVAPHGGGAKPPPATGGGKKPDAYGER